MQYMVFINLKIKHLEYLNKNKYIFVNITMKIGFNKNLDLCSNNYAIIYT